MSTVSVSTLDTIMTSSIISSNQANSTSSSTPIVTNPSSTNRTKSIRSTLFHPIIALFLFLRELTLYSIHLFIKNSPNTVNTTMEKNQPPSLSVNLHLNSTTYKDFIKFITTAEPPSFKLSKRLKPRLEKKILVLDLDETLIHSSIHSSKGFDQMIEVFIDKLPRLYYVFKRPNVDSFLRKVSEWYEVVIFTASVPEYANPVINLLDIDHTLISRRFYRQSCTSPGTGYVKDLRQIDSDLSKIILVDNAAVSFQKNLNNGIPIKSWYNDNSKDQALLDLLPVLDSLRFVSDTRSLLSLRSE